MDAKIAVSGRIDLVTVTETDEKRATSPNIFSMTLLSILY